VSGDRIVPKLRIPGTFTMSWKQMSGTADGVVAVAITVQRRE